MILVIGHVLYIIEHNSLKYLTIERHHNYTCLTCTIKLDNYTRLTVKFDNFTHPAIEQLGNFTHPAIEQLDKCTHPAIEQLDNCTHPATEQLDNCTDLAI